MKMKTLTHRAPFKVQKRFQIVDYLRKNHAVFRIKEDDDDDGKTPSIN